MIDCVLLDAGGVLLDLDYAYVRRLLSAKGVDVEVERLKVWEAHSRREVDRHVADGGSTAGRWRDYFRTILREAGIRDLEVQDGMIDSLWEAHRRFGLWTVPMPGAVEAVRALREAGLAVGVVSNAEGRVEQDLAAAGFDGLFRTVVDSHVVGVAKPDPAIFRIALERMDATPERTLFVGDVPSVDVVGARAAGIDAWLVDPHDLYPDADAPRLASIRELPQRLAAERA